MPQIAPHIPVLLDEVIDALAISPGETHIDGTFGAGGYSRAMIKAGAKVIAFDRDPDAIAAGLFGVEVSLDASDRMGDVIAIAHGEMILIEAEREKQEGAMVGHHGGATDIESFVPLLTHVTS